MYVNGGKMYRNGIAAIQSGWYYRWYRDLHLLCGSEGYCNFWYGGLVSLGGLESLDPNIHLQDPSFETDTCSSRYRLTYRIQDSITCPDREIYRIASLGCTPSTLLFLVGSLRS